MALTKEDGSQVANANTFVDVAEFKAYADLRGITYGTDPEIEILLIRAMDYLAKYEPRMKGTRVEPSVQLLLYPRDDVDLFGESIEDDFIPQQLKDAQIQLAIEAISTDALLPNGTGQEVIKNKVGPIEQEFADSGNDNLRPTYNSVDVIIDELLTSGGLVRTLRI